MEDKINKNQKLQIKFESEMKKLQNPTTFFFKQADRLTNDFSEEIEKFVAKLINKDTCQLCKQDYDIGKNIPRILIHCGHTFCTPCLNKFFMNRRVRCPMCLKLVKYIDSIQRLPINHSIYHHLAEKQNKKSIQRQDRSNIIDAGKFLFGEFERVQKQAHMSQNPRKIDPDSGLPFCVFHNDRVEHFYCQSHRNSGCRVCIEIGHSKPDCKVIDLYNVENPEKYLHPLQQGIEMPDVSQPFLNMNGNHSNILGLNYDDEDEELEQDGDDEDENEVENESSSSGERKSI